MRPILFQKQIITNWYLWQAQQQKPFPVLQNKHDKTAIDYRYILHQNTMRQAIVNFGKIFYAAR